MPKVRPVCSMVSFLAHDITSISFASSCSFLLHLATWVSFSFFPKVSVDLWIDESSGLSFTSKEIFFSSSPHLSLLRFLWRCPTWLQSRYWAGAHWGMLQRMAWQSMASHHSHLCWGSPCFEVDRAFSFH